MPEQPEPGWLPMFPLGRRMFPGALLTLQVFEPRYLEMIEMCIRRRIGFGVVLIERGSEVGGGDTRFDVGVATEIEGVGLPGHGRILLAVRGRSRIRVDEWLPDDPYPRARVGYLLDPAGFNADPRARGRLEKVYTRGLALLSEMGADTAGIPPLPADTLAASYRALEVFPVPELDRQRVLEVDDPAERIECSITALESANRLTEARLAGG